MPLKLKPVLILLLCIGIHVTANCQDMIQLFYSLPAECTPEITNTERKILVKKGDYILPRGDSSETVKYSIDTSDIKAGYLSYNYYFTTGQAGFILFEIKKLTKSDGSSILVYSRYGGMKKAFEQQELQVFNIKNGELIENNDSLLPDSIPVADFIDPSTPPGVKKEIIGSLSTYYDLNPDDGENIRFQIFPEYMDDSWEKWILYYGVEFVWDGNKFTKKFITAK